MADRGVVLLTGATGFIGTHIARRLLADTACTVVALVRADTAAEAAQRLERTWWEWTELVGAIGACVQVIAGDLRAPGLGLDPGTFEDVQRRVTHVIHAAADLRADAAIDQLRRTNVDGTAHVLELARAAHRDHGLARFAHVSTAYVCGKRRGAIDEASFTAAFGFSTNYEQSKFESEALVRAAATELPVSIFRPAMVVGDSRTGAIKTFNTLYAPLRLYLTGQLPFVPASPAMRLNIVPVDYVADAVVRLTFDIQAAGMTFHVVPRPEERPTVGELLDTVRDWAERHLDTHLRRRPFAPLPLSALPGRLARGEMLRTLRVLRPYFEDWREFRRDNVDRHLGPSMPQWRDYLPRLLEYAVAYGFMRRSDRTVHEQILHRLASPHRAVTYHDITAHGLVTRRADDVRAEMLAAATALRALGIRAGDRVAIVGTNSSRYLALDVAIGLIGAVSVPLYYTSPPGEIDALVSACGARALLIGAPRVLERSVELHTDVPLVAFCCGALPPGAPDRMLSWTEFLALTDGGPDELVPEAVGFGDVATIRYTSGTTGQPKGVMFHHGNLRWMAETMAGLLPWRARTRRVTYLSFLPMNHVVEGILATYSAYYVPAAVDVYFLEDFRVLPAALRMARPTVFFSVPRVYEKMWENVTASRLGRCYLRAANGPIKSVLRWITRGGLLRRAGLDRSVQLIIGSAAVSETLLQSFRDLGIEVHNAYGLTEAPLVTLNRLCANMLGTVGQPLPLTDIAIAADGEVLVRGPQVTPGYDGDVQQPFQHGWLLTGDLGHLTPNGNLVIEGRKKEIIATSYGKKIQPARIEDLLRQIPNVGEALVVGEGRPFCVALLWSNAPRSAVADIDAGVEWVNAQLSHAEQMKHWAVLDNDLSIDGGDLTPNLKLKRAAVTRRFKRVIQSLYGEAVAA